MRQHTRTFAVLTMTAGLLLVGAAAMAQGRRGAPPRPSHPPVPSVPSVPSHRSVYVFIGGYFYDPFFGPYPWWPRRIYPYPYFPVYDTRAEVRVLVTPREAAVYVDGFYAGIVDDFNGFFERLGLPPGGHEIVLYLQGFRTARHRIYLSPASSFRLQFAMERLPPGEIAELPVIAPPPPAPPEGSFIPPHTPPPRVIAPAAAPSPPAAVGTLTLRVQPADAEVTIDGERWLTSDGGRFAIQLGAGRHRVDVSKLGYQRFSTEVEVREGESVPLNVSLLQQRP